MAKNPFIAVRVPPEVIRSLDEVAIQSGISRSTLIRDLLANCHSFYSFLELERERQKTDRIKLDGNLTKWILDNMPESVTPDWAHFLGETLHRVADTMVAQKEKQKS